MPTPRSGFVAATLNGVIYTIGGRTAAGIVAKVEAYCPCGGLLAGWRPKASLPAKRVAPSGAAVIKGKIYVPGGGDDSGIDHIVKTKTLFVYTPSSNSWETKTAMPVVTAGGASGAINGKLYVYTPVIDGAGPFLHRYDPDTDTWTTRATPPHGNHGVAGAVIAGKFYLAGGESYGGAAVATLDVYDPATNAWTTRKPMPRSRGWAAARGVHGQLYVMGGTNTGTSALSRVDSYDPVTNTWTWLPGMRTARSGLAAAVVDGVIYALGGYDGTHFVAANEAYGP